MGFITATADRLTIRNFTEPLALTGAIAASGFRRYSTYRQATVASLATNIMFGFLRTYILLAVAAVSAVTAGYTGPQLVTYVWAGQGLLGVVMLWGWNDLAERIRTGDVVTDLLRPIHPVISYLAADLGRAGYAMIFRFIPPMIVGAVFFDLYLPADPVTYPLFLISVLLAVVVCFGCRYLVNATAFWLLDNRGVNLFWLFASGLIGGLYFPVRFLPEPVAALVWFATPGPSLLMAPMDVLVERDELPIRLGMMAVQAFWAGMLLWTCRVVQRRAERRLVIQGG
ncbi:ABC transporter permease [Allorhizocola rhizosphaerae]|uniref:ABC transporter permease n=1 Tax=Allorhizocola rhizosphaerae TaxID=1872709 RepID=UPI003CCC88AA